MKKRKRRLKKGFKVLLIVLILLGIIFAIFSLKDEIGSFFTAQTGFSISLPDFLSFGKKDEEIQWQEQPAENAQPTADDAGSTVDQRIAALEENTIIGIQYPSMHTDPSTMALRADRIIKFKVKSSMPMAGENAIYSDIKADVKKTYKGKETKQIQFSTFGGTVQVIDLKAGQIRDTASKTDSFGQEVTAMMDFCEELKKGEEYIGFFSETGGILTPLCGNLSFFRIDGRSIVRKSSADEDFNMKFKDFEKQFLKE